MYTTRVRISAVALAATVLIMMGSASEAWGAGNVQAIPKMNALCASGRCIKLVGQIVATMPGTTTRIPAIMMLDLVYRYLGADTAMGGGKFPVTNINYLRNMIFFEAPVPMPPGYLRCWVLLGLPSTAFMDVEFPGTPLHEVFFGLGSFYYRVDANPF